MGLICSKSATVSLRNVDGARGRPHRQTPAPQGRRRALMIGINYIGTDNQLYGCINDVNNMRALLVSQFGFADRDIRMMFDDGMDPSDPNYPSKANMLSAMRAFSASLQPGDVGYLHYSGHGTQVPGNDPGERDGMDEALVPADFDISNPASFIIDDVVNNVLRCPLGAKLFVVLDCCHSETAVDLGYEDINGRTKPIRPAYRDNGGLRVCLSGCKDQQTSADSFADGEAQGALTRCLRLVLERYPRGFTYNTLLNDTRELVKTMSPQVPEMCFSSDVDPTTTCFLTPASSRGVIPTSRSMIVVSPDDDIDYEELWDKPCAADFVGGDGCNDDGSDSDADDPMADLARFHASCTLDVYKDSVPPTAEGVLCMAIKAVNDPSLEELSPRDRKKAAMAAAFGFIRSLPMDDAAKSRMRHAVRLLFPSMITYLLKVHEEQ